MRLTTLTYLVKEKYAITSYEFWTPARDIKDRRALLSDEPVLFKGLGTDGDWQKGCDVWQWIWRFRNGFGVSLTSNETTDLNTGATWMLLLSIMKI